MGRILNSSGLHSQFLIFHQNTSTGFFKKLKAPFFKKPELILIIVYHNFLGLYVNSKYQFGSSDTRAGQKSTAKTFTF